jgi:hypothetical protein
MNDLNAITRKRFLVRQIVVQIVCRSTAISANEEPENMRYVPTRVRAPYSFLVGKH